MIHNDMEFKVWMEKRERGAAGALIVAKDTGRILLQHRSKKVGNPGTWAMWGGGIEDGESPEEATRREIGEEAGEIDIKKMVKLGSSKKDGFEYHSFVAFVPKEFKPSINWESQGYRWVEFGDWPEPLHKGLEKLLTSEEDKIRKITKI